jgi:ABC-2 type transport system permease protein
MNFRNSITIVRKDLVLGPRTIMFIWIIGFPLIITFLVRLVFGGLIDPSPRLGIVDHGSSVITELAGKLEGVEVTVVESGEELKKMVEENEYDAGLILQEDFDNAVKTGRNIELQFFVGGKSLASDRMVLAVTLADLLREITGEPFDVEVTMKPVGSGPSVPIGERLVPLLVLLTVAFAGIFLPAASIIQERENRTIDAVLASPVKAGDFVTAKGIVGFLLAFIAGGITLLLNGGFTGIVGGQLLILAVAAFMSVDFGLILGCAVGDMATMFSVWKGGGIILFAPALLFLFPSVPRWAARFFPTYYFLGPLYEVSVEGAAFNRVLLDLGIGFGISVGLAFIVKAFAGRMKAKQAAG